jgi:hypothetical protein
LDNYGQKDHLRLYGRKLKYLFNSSNFIYKEYCAELETDSKLKIIAKKIAINFK